MSIQPHKQIYHFGENTQLLKRNQFYMILSQMFKDATEHHEKLIDIGKCLFHSCVGIYVLKAFYLRAYYSTRRKSDIFGEVKPGLASNVANAIIDLPWLCTFGKDPINVYRGTIFNFFKLLFYLFFYDEESAKYQNFVPRTFFLMLVRVKLII
ncbi:hypothetical protein BDA99DRAFT_543315 [Phascolomyces articulosus]|uniref:Uncharacterized protein n=1 Tax=Phascolomyces articulosus TaxID=60185 RepID=A0AAD5P7T4_9FUNG|nr:hypothetical protein BDA99DRAFT_543315 [Phascolomyces articulosus]